MMPNLLELPKRVAAAVLQPLTRDDGMRRRTKEGLLMSKEANELIKPNDRLSSFERLEIYNRQYWFRVLSSFAEDFPGLRAVVGARKFEALMRAYLIDCPSQSFSLRNLGSRLENWLRQNPRYTQPHQKLALDMARIEWAHIEAFDEACFPVLTPADIENAGDDLRFALQPYIRLLDLSYPVDDFLIEVHQSSAGDETSSNAAHERAKRVRLRRFTQPEPEAIYLAVHRMENTVYYSRLDPEAFRLLAAFSQGLPLETALDGAFTESSMPLDDRPATIQGWFAAWGEFGWFCRTSSADRLNADVLIPN